LNARLNASSDSYPTRRAIAKIVVSERAWQRSPPAGPSPRPRTYRVVAEPDDTFVGTVNEDWAIESMAGDVFLLGTTSWRIRRVEPGTVRVVDAQGAPPSVPFWLGEAPGRTEELSAEVSDVRMVVGERLQVGDPDGARDRLRQQCGIDEAAADTIVRPPGSSTTLVRRPRRTNRLDSQAESPAPAIVACGPSWTWRRRGSRVARPSRWIALLAVVFGGN
jgi:hypothetical protein